MTPTIERPRNRLSKTHFTHLADDLPDEDAPSHLGHPSTIYTHRPSTAPESRPYLPSTLAATRRDNENNNTTATATATTKVSSVTGSLRFFLGQKLFRKQSEKKRMKEVFTANDEKPITDNREFSVGPPAYFSMRSRGWDAGNQYSGRRESDLRRTLTNPLSRKGLPSFTCEETEGRKITKPPRIRSHRIV